MKLTGFPPSLILARSILRRARIERGPPDRRTLRGVTLAARMSDGPVGPAPARVADCVRYRQRVAALEPAPRAVEAERLAGRSFFLGFHEPHFGHFLTETLCRLAALSPEERDRYDHFALFAADRPVRRPHEAAFRTLGLAGRVRVLRRAAQFDEVDVTDAPISLSGPVHDCIADLPRLCGVREAGERDGPPLFLSRAGFGANGTGRVVVGEDLIEAAFRRAGAEVLRPETVDFAAQVDAVARAGAVVGFAGSALHLMLLAGGGKHIVAYSDRVPPPVFGQIDRCLGNDAEYLYAGLRLRGLMRPKIGFAPQVLDVGRLLSALAARGLIDPAEPDRFDEAAYRRGAARAHDTAALVRFMFENRIGARRAAARAEIARLRAAHEIDDVGIARLAETTPWLRAFMADEDPPHD